MKKSCVILGIIVLFLGAVVVYQGATISRLNKDFVRPINQCKCIEVVEGDIYITANADAKKIFAKYMQQKGFVYDPEEQLGAGYCFRKDSEMIYYGRRDYKNYVLWKCLD